MRNVAGEIFLITLEKVEDQRRKEIAHACCPTPVIIRPIIDGVECGTEACDEVNHAAAAREAMADDGGAFSAAVLPLKQGLEVGVSFEPPPAPGPASAMARASAIT